jgi:DNA helicase-2/ATP-dependent DNA helicase PcrA
MLIAGPGSGKTRVITHRIAALLSAGVAPWNILAVTFTNKAAGEMRERLAHMIDPAQASRLWVSTFHSLCVRLLRMFAAQAGLAESFNIADTDDTKKMIRNILNDRGLHPDDSKRYSSAISWAKNNLQGPAEIESDLPRIAEVFTDYQSALAAAHLVDFDDLLTLTLALLRVNPDVLRQCQDRFHYVMVDEFQDTNAVQYEIVRLLASRSNNICVVGDQDQCLLHGTLVSTPSGPKPIEEIAVGDMVLATHGADSTKGFAVRETKQGTYEGPVVTVTTGEMTVSATPHHLVPARFEPTAGEHFVYLMWRADMGYRIGRTKSCRSSRSGEIKPGFQVRMNQERGDRLWVLRQCATLKEATYHEALYATQFGIPTACFHVTSREMALDDQDLVRLSDNIDTTTRARELMDALLIHEDFPHYTAQNGPHRQAVLVTMFGDGRGSHPGHHISWTTSDETIVQNAKLAGFSVRSSRKNGSGYQIETMRADYRDALLFAKELSKHSAAPIRRQMKINGETYMLMPVSHLHPGMRVLVEHEGTLVEQSVDDVVVSDYQGLVYDMEVARAHNYVADGFLVHNSIYRWRGALAKAVEGFAEDFPGTVVIPLDQNYRSTSRILDVVATIIAANPAKHRAHLWTENEAGAPVRLVECADDAQEATFVAQELANMTGTTAIIVRTNAQTKAFEAALTQRRITYSVVGTQRFFDRAEVKDALAWLRLALNPADLPALTRVAGNQKGLGDKTLAALVTFAKEHGLDPLAATAHPELAEVLNARGVNLCATLAANVTAVFDSAQASGPDGALETAVSKALADAYANEPERLENVYQLVADAKTLSRDAIVDPFAFEESGDPDPLSPLGLTRRFIENAQLASAADQGDDATSHVSVITAHASKGREFDNVFVAGVEDNVYPHHMVGADQASIAEERRLLFVAASRARQRLTLLHCRRRQVFGKWQDAQPSPFIANLPAHVETVELAGPATSSFGPRGTSYAPRRPGAPGSSTSRGSYQSRTSLPPARTTPAPTLLRATTPPGPRPAPLDAAQLTAGTKVSHPAFGIGVVTWDTNGQTVKIRFEDKARELVIELAPLTLVEDQP